MDAFIGTSGYQYSEWSQIFYPVDLKHDKYLKYYGENLNAVEINSTFYRLPGEQILQSWAQQVPQHFRFSIKASQRITHQRLLNTESIGDLEYLLTSTALLGVRLGAILFQTPPTFRPDMRRLEQFVQLFPPEVPAAFEFRHRGWQQQRTTDILASRNFAWCITDSDHRDASFACTADWGYLRLRKSGYTQDQMRWWIEQIRRQPWSRVFVFFKHGTEGAQSPVLARQFSRFWREMEREKEMVGYRG
ncbi:MAG: DUF72 domain-containing protein [Chitinispirillaceae bacterium]